jgi:hypothetical protein
VDQADWATIYKVRRFLLAEAAHTGWLRAMVWLDDDCDDCDA